MSHKIGIPSSTDSYTKGGQIFGHVWRMRWQNIKIALKVSALTFISVTLLAAFLKPLSLWHLWDFYLLSYLGGYLKVLIFDLLKEAILVPGDIFLRGLMPGSKGIPLAFKSVHHLTTTLFVPELGREATFWTGRFLKDPWTLMKASEVHGCMLWGVWANLLTLLALVWHFKSKSDSAQRKRLLQGYEIATTKEVARLMKKQKIASKDFLIAKKLPFVKDSETLHTLILGTTGVGKTNTFQGLLKQIRAQSQKAIIFDTNCGYVNRFYNPETDIILNPLDQRSVHWNLWLDCQETAEFDEFAASLIPEQRGSSSPVWYKSAREIVSATAERLFVQKNLSFKALIDYAARLDLKDIKDFYKGTSMEGFLSGKEDAEATVKGVRMQMLGEMKRLGLLSQEGGTFSLKDWVRDERGGWLFISCSHGDRSTLGALMQFWISLSMRSLMKLGENPKRRLWFIMDELFAVEGGKLETLEELLREGRKYGGCAVLGLQDLGGLEKAYGHHGMKTILSLCNTKIIMKTPEPHTADYLSKALGEQEILEVSENLSIGAHHMRDGLNMNAHKRVQPVVTKSALMMMNPHEGYVFLPRSLPIVKVKFEHHKAEIKWNEQEFRRSGIVLDKGEPYKGECSLGEEPQENEESSSDQGVVPREELQEAPLDLKEETISSGKEETLNPFEDFAPQKSPYSLVDARTLGTKARVRYEKILTILMVEARHGNLYTKSTFAHRFASVASCGSVGALHTLLTEMSVKGLIAYSEVGKPYGLEDTSPGYIVYKGMTVLLKDVVDTKGQEILAAVPPTHYVDKTDGAMKPIL